DPASAICLEGDIGGRDGAVDPEIARVVQQKIAAADGEAIDRGDGVGGAGEVDGASDAAGTLQLCAGDQGADSALRHTAAGGGQIDGWRGDQVARVELDSTAAGCDGDAGDPGNAAVDRDAACVRVADANGRGRDRSVDAEQAGVAVVAQQEVSAGHREGANRRDVVGSTGEIHGAGDAAGALQGSAGNEDASRALCHAATRGGEINDGSGNEVSRIQQNAAAAGHERDAGCAGEAAVDRNHAGVGITDTDDAGGYRAVDAEQAGIAVVAQQEVAADDCEFPDCCDIVGAASEIDSSGDAAGALQDGAGNQRAGGILCHTAARGGEINSRGGDEVPRVQFDAATAGRECYTGGAGEAAVDRDRAGVRIADADDAGGDRTSHVQQAGIAVVAQQEVAAGHSKLADRRDIVGGAGEVDCAGDATGALQHRAGNQRAGGALRHTAAGGGQIDGGSGNDISGIEQNAAAAGGEGNTGCARHAAVDRNAACVRVADANGRGRDRSVDAQQAGDAVVAQHEVAAGDGEFPDCRDVVGGPGQIDRASDAAAALQDGAGDQCAARILRHAAAGGGKINGRAGDEAACVQQDAAAAGGQRHTGRTGEAAIDGDGAGVCIADANGAGGDWPGDSQQAGVTCVAQQEIAAFDGELPDRGDIVGGAGQIHCARHAAGALQHAA